MSEWTYDEPDVGTWWMEWPGGAIEVVEVRRPQIGALLCYTRSGNVSRYQVASAKGHRWCRAEYPAPPPRRDVFDEIADEYYGDRNERGTWGIVLAAHLRKNADRIREAKS